MRLPILIKKRHIPSDQLLDEILSDNRVSLQKQVTNSNASIDPQLLGLLEHSKSSLMPADDPQDEELKDFLQQVMIK